jgi:hypothetical protein
MRGNKLYSKYFAVHIRAWGFRLFSLFAVILDLSMYSCGGEAHRAGDRESAKADIAFNILSKFIFVVFVRSVSGFIALLSLR